VRACVGGCVGGCVRACVRACVRVCVRACVRASVRASVPACVCVGDFDCVCVVWTAMSGTAVISIVFIRMRGVRV